MTQLFLASINEVDHVVDVVMIIGNDHITAATPD